MAIKRALKVFRTSAGFEDAYIAAPSQKAALEAWGAKRNLFAQGGAEVVKDPDLIKAALAYPGEVLRVPRGTTAEHLAAAGSGRGRVRKLARSKASEARQRPPKPRPSREKLDSAREQLEGRRREFEADEAGVAAQIEQLKGQLARQKRQHREDIARLEERVDEQERVFRKALADWEG